MRLIIAGSRDFTNYTFLRDKLDFLLKNIEEEIEIVCGEARGADKLGRQYGEFRGYKIKSFPANWDLGKGAGFLRNREMAQYGTHLVAFWDQKSPGTKMMIDLAKEYNLPTRVIKV